jgi:outer membrane protein assembly factor BamB
VSGAAVVRRVRRLALLGACFGAALAIAACAGKNATRPEPLVKLANRIHIARAWHVHLSREAPKLRLGLNVATAGQRVFAASHGGVVEAFDLASGRRLWRRKVRAALAGGPGTGDGLVVVGGSKGDVIALSQADGKPRWRRRIDSEIIAAPAVGDDLVAVRGVDGRLEALSTADGTDRWIVNQPVPQLSLRGTSRPILIGDLAICGFDNGRLLAVARADGMTAWNAVIGEPHGSSELQRLIDLDAPVIAAGDDLYAVAYQGRVVRLVRDTGQSVWTRDLSSFRGLAVDGDAVYVSTAEGDLVRLDRRTGTVQWQQKMLERRELSAPVVYRGRVVVGDLEGYVHWFDPATGAYLARERAGKDRISTTPVVAGDLLLVFTDGGDLSAFRGPLPTVAAAPAPKVKAKTGARAHTASTAGASH